MSETRQRLLAEFIRSYVAADSATGASAIRHSYSTCVQTMRRLRYHGYRREDLHTIGREAIRAVRRARCR